MRAPTEIRAVTFDVGGTLIEPWPSVGAIYAQVAAAHGRPGLSPEELNRRFGAALDAHGNAVNTEEEWARIVDETFAGLLPRPPSETFFAELYERFARADAWRMFDDVEPTLSALRKRGLKLGVISNWDDRLRPLLKSLKLDTTFDPVLISCEVGASKPAPAIFAAAAEQLSAHPGSVLHVGDSFEMDVVGARAAGFQAVQIERKTGPAGDGQIPSLLDLLRLAGRVAGE